MLKIQPRYIAAIMGEDVKLIARGVAALGFIVFLQTMNWACSSRATPPVVSLPPQPDQPSIPPSAVPSPPEPPAAAAPGREAGSSRCALIAESGEPVATVAVGDAINPLNAPHPSNESERLLFRQLYETLVSVDCDGRARPGLAESWRVDADGRTWIVTLRENARFSDGTPVTSVDVRAGWTRDGRGDELRPQASRLVQSIAPVDDRTIAIVLRSGRADAPLALAHPDLAIARAVAGSRWPLGTRSRRIASESRSPAARAATAITVARDDGSTIRFVGVAGDPRDLLDEGVDLLLTRDRAALDYAATLPQFSSVPLAWHRVHVLLTPGRSRVSSLLSENARQMLAADAVRGEARGARGPFWWQMVPDCAVTPYPPLNQSPPSPRIVYDAGDPAARDLAERFVGLARASGAGATELLDALLAGRSRRAYQSATGLTGEALASARRMGADAGYVVSLDSRPLDACRELHALVDGARWLDPETIVPLVETRLRAIVRRGRSGVTAEWDGGLLLAGANDPR